MNFVEQVKKIWVKESNHNWLISNPGAGCLLQPAPGESLRGVEIQDCYLSLITLQIQLNFKIQLKLYKKLGKKSYQKYNLLCIDRTEKVCYY